jgi:hypothetical protein
VGEKMIINYFHSKLIVWVIHFLYFTGYLLLTILMLALYIRAFDPYIEDNQGLGSFCLATSIFVFFIHRALTKTDRQLASTNEQT